MTGFTSFLARKNIVFSFSRYGLDAMSAMAQGLFCSLLIGTILKTLGAEMGVTFLEDAGSLAQSMAGPAMAAAIGYALRAPSMVLFTLIPVGYYANSLAGAGGPFAVYIVAIIATETGKAVSGETKVDLLVTPAITLLCGVGAAMLVAVPVGSAANWVGKMIMWGTELHPFIMGIVVSALAGMALTLPISSAAICAGLGLTGLAGGAALAGCCAQMVGFAVMSFPENRWGGLISQGIGTSMLQMGNILHNPKIWIPPILTSMITGPVATCLFSLQMNGAAVNSGMGTCGMCGPIGVITGWTNPTLFDWCGLTAVSIVLPALICPAICLLLRRIGWIAPGDLALQK